MSVSMKDLASSSDDEIYEVDEHIEQKAFSPHVLVKNKHNKGDLNKNYFSINTLKQTSILKSEESKHDESRSLSIKGQVSESFKRIPSQVALSPSLESSTDEYFEDVNQKEIPLLFKESKTASESDMKVQSDNLDGRDVVSKRQWIKGHLNSYLSKSKNYYNRSVAATNIEKNSKFSPADSNSKELVSDSSTAECSHSFDKSANIKIPSMNLSSICDEYQSTPSSSDTSCNSPKFLVKHEKIDHSIKSLKKESADLISTMKKEQKTKSSTPRLTFSELLDSEYSQTSCKQSMPTDNTLSETMSDTLNTVSTDTEKDEWINHLTDQIVKEDLKFHLRPSDGSSITYFSLWICSLFTCAYFLYPLPMFLSGIVAGSVITYLSVCITIWLLCPSADIYDQYHSDLKSFLRKNRQPETVKGLPNPDVLIKPKDLKTWMFVAKTFNTVFEAELAQEIFVVAHKETLFLFLCKVIDKVDCEAVKSLEKKKRKPLRGKSKKRARMLAEKQVPLFSFEYMCQVDLGKCLLELKPDDLPIRRIWSRKYPIKLTVPKDKLKKQKIDLTLEELTLSLDEIVEGGFNADVDEVITCNNEEEIFYLFGNTGREKETLFYRLQLCITPLKHQVTLKDIKNNKLSKQPSDSYPYYMAELITESKKVMQRTANGKKMEPYLAWLNIFLGRAFWDFWHDSIWANKLRQKIQSRLSKINTPPFITDIKLKDLNCGHNIPIIHKGSIPVLDEYGVWTDLQISYKGYFTLTLETQLNIDYYIDLVSSIMKQKTNTDSKDHSQLSQMTKLSGISNQDDDEFDKDSSEEQKDPSDDIDGAQFSVMDDESVFHSEIQDAYSDAFDNVDVDHEIDPVLADPRTKAFLESRAGKKVVSLVGWLAKSKIAKKVAGTEFAKKAYERAYKKFQKMPIVLKVEVQSVKGNLAVNIPPPPTNRLWFGFRGNPVIFITASPKVGDKQVCLTYLTNWIEKKLKEEFKKYLVMPNMQDLSIKLMDSHLQDISPDRPLS